MRGRITVVSAAIVAVLLILLAAWAIRLLPGAVNAALDMEAAGVDPMFAPPVSRVTRPPSPDDDEPEALPEADDPSRHWHYPTLTPVDSEGYAVE